MLEVKELSFAYKHHRVLEKVSFTAAKGEILCLLGKNGAGKTTLFRCVLGMLRGYCGTVLVDGDDLHTLSIRETAKRIAYIPQAHDAAYNYSVAEMVLMGTTVLTDSYRTPGKKEAKVVAEALETAGIAHLAERGYAKLSGGERQLVIIARALAQQSRILIMDEPTANLDYGNQIKVMQQAKALAGKGYTILLSTHNPEHALCFADKALVLDEQSILGWGEPKAVLTAEILQQIYGVTAEIAMVNTAWGRMPLIAPRL